MKVISSPGTRTPVENKPREYITDGKAVDVEATAYYRRLVGDGSLLIVAPATDQTPGKKEVKHG